MNILPSRRFNLLSLTLGSKVGTKHLKCLLCLCMGQVLWEPKGPTISVAHLISLKNKKKKKSPVLLNFSKFRAMFSFLDDFYTVTSQGKVA